MEEYCGESIVIHEKNICYFDATPITRSKTFHVSQKHYIIINIRSSRNCYWEVYQARSFIIHHVQSCLSDEFNRIPCQSIYNNLSIIVADAKMPLQMFTLKEETLVVV